MLIVIAFGSGATKSAAPVGKSVGKAQECGKGTRDVALCVELIDECATARRPLLGMADELVAHLWTVRWSPALSVSG